MRPQLQAVRTHDPEAGLFGDCHRTCIAMILDVDRDEVPHFMDGVPRNAGSDHPECLRAEAEERAWLAGWGLTPVNVAFPGDLSLAQLMELLAFVTREAAVVLGCTSSSGTNHSVVYYQGRIYNPNTNTIVGPMRDGLWWITIYARATNPLQPEPTPASVATQEDD